jgi:hypothetical protein
VSAPTRRCVLRHSRPHLEHAADAGRCRDFERRGALEAADVGARQSMLCILYDRYTVVVMEFNLTLNRQIQDKLGTLAPPNKFDTYPGRAAIMFRRGRVRWCRTYRYSPYRPAAREKPHIEAGHTSAPDHMLTEGKITSVNFLPFAPTSQIRR